MQRPFVILIPAIMALLLLAAGMALVIVAGLAGGAVLNWLAPSVGMEAATIVGVLAVLTVVSSVLKFLQLTVAYDETGALEDDDVDDVDIMDEHVEDVAERVADAILNRLPVPPGKAGRRPRTSAR